MKRKNVKKIGKLFLQTFQNIAHLFDPKTQSGKLNSNTFEGRGWEGGGVEVAVRGGGCCLYDVNQDRAYNKT